MENAGLFWTGFVLRSVFSVRAVLPRLDLSARIPTQPRHVRWYEPHNDGPPPILCVLKLRLLLLVLVILFLNIILMMITSINIPFKANILIISTIHLL